MPWWNSPNHQNVHNVFQQIFFWKALLRNYVQLKFQPDKGIFFPETVAQLQKGAKQKIWRMYFVCRIKTVNFNNQG